MVLLSIEILIDDFFSFRTLNMPLLLDIIFFLFLMRNQLLISYGASHISFGTFKIFSVFDI